LTAGSVLQALGVDQEGLTPAETEARLKLYGANALPKGRPPSLVWIFLRQFLSPLIYVLLLAGIISLIRGAFGDAVFIGVVTLINAIIGTTQEWSAQRAAAALKYRVPSRARVQRVGEIYEIDTEELVPGDIVVLAVGDKVPADLRLLCAQGLELDESVLTGESSPVVKRPEAVLSPETPISDRINICFS
jgi:P-type Ca2+ transporter type 2C